MSLRAQSSRWLPQLSSAPSTGVKGKAQHSDQVCPSPDGERVSLALGLNLCFPDNSALSTMTSLSASGQPGLISSSPSFLFNHSCSMSVSKRLVVPFPALLPKRPGTSPTLSSSPNLSQSLTLLHCTLWTILHPLCASPLPHQCSNRDLPSPKGPASSAAWLSFQPTSH